MQVNAKRELGPVTMHYRIGEGDEQTVSTQEWKGGERYGDEGDTGTTASAARSPARSPART